jgi:hypothetical protein
MMFLIVGDGKSVVSRLQPSRPLRSLPFCSPALKGNSFMNSAQGRVRKLVGILRRTSILVQHHLNDGQPLPELAELRRSLERAVAALELHVGSHDDHGAVREFADQD